jgi:hypothetical protein
MNVFLVMLLNVLYKFGLCDYLAPGSPAYQTLRHMGLAKNISLISIFALSHVNQSKYIGVSTVDSIQYMMIRVLPLLLQFLIILKSDYVGTMKYHFEQLLFVLFYLAYFIFSDYRRSRENRLAEMLDEALNDGGQQHQYAQKTRSRVVLIFFRGDGRGGIQGILMDCYFMNFDGRIANEFYIVTDNDEGEIRKLERHELCQLEDELKI